MATGPPKNVSRHPPFRTDATRTPRDKKKCCGFPCVGKRIPPTRFQITIISRKAKKTLKNNKKKNARRLSKMTFRTKTNLKKKSWESSVSGVDLVAHFCPREKWTEKQIKKVRKKQNKQDCCLKKKPKTDFRHFKTWKNGKTNIQMAINKRCQNLISTNLEIIVPNRIY